jgi:hypothetical protein
MNSGSEEACFLKHFGCYLGLLALAVVSFSLLMGAL